MSPSRLKDPRDIHHHDSAKDLTLATLATLHRPRAADPSNAATPPKSVAENPMQVSLAQKKTTTKLRASILNHYYLCTPKSPHSELESVELSLLHGLRPNKGLDSRCTKCGSRMVTGVYFSPQDSGSGKDCYSLLAPIALVCAWYSLTN